MQEREEQRYKIAAGDQTLFVSGHDATGWTVWLDTDQDFDGVHLGSGFKRAAAINSAVEILLEGVRTLRALNGTTAPPASDRPNPAS